MTAAQKLDLAWRLRFDQRNEEALSLWCEVRDELAIERGLLNENDIRVYMKRENASDVLDAVFLQASLTRLQGHFSESNRILGLVDQVLSDMGAPLPARCLIEKGLNLLAVGDFTNAQEYFLTARGRAKDSFQKLTSLTNLITCLDELGLSHDHAFKEVDELIKAMRPDQHGLSGTIAHLEHIRVRQLFRRGQFQELLEKPIDCSQVDHTTYFKIWLLALPYHRFHRDQFAEFERFVQESVHMFHRAYRLRTLQVILHPDDLQSFKPGEWADRLYLWTWKWLTNPDSFAIKRLMVTLSALPLDSAVVSRLSAEDRQLVRNAILWLVFFDKQSSPRLSELLKSLQVSEFSSAPLLAFESLMIQFLIAKRDGDEVTAQDYLRNIRMSPLHKLEDLSLFAVAMHAARLKESENLAPHLLCLANTLRSVCDQTSRSHDAWFFVDVSTFEISDARRKNVVVSEQIAKALMILSQQNSILAADMLRECFGIRRFDAVIHNPRLFNLLWRMKQMFQPHMNFKMKGGLIVSEGDWDAFCIVGAEPLSLLLQSQKEWQHLGADDDLASRKVKKHAQPPVQNITRKLASKPEAAVWTRKELEERIGKSRATTNRILKQWEEHGWVKRFGRGRAISYKLSQQALKRLNEEMI